MSRFRKPLFRTPLFLGPSLSSTHRRWTSKVSKPRSKQRRGYIFQISCFRHTYLGVCRSKMWADVVIWPYYHRISQMGQMSTSQSMFAPARASLNTTWPTGTTTAVLASRDPALIRIRWGSPNIQIHSTFLNVKLKSQRAALMGFRISIMWVVDQNQDVMFFPSVPRCSDNSLLPPLLPRGEPAAVFHRTQPRPWEASTLP